MKKLILTMCLAATGVFGAAAQMRLTLGEALDLALSENPTVKVAEMEVQRFDYVKRQTWGAGYLRFRSAAPIPARSSSRA